MSNTIKNKMYSIALMATGIVPVLICGDATFLLVISFVAIPMFFSKENWIY